MERNNRETVFDRAVYACIIVGIYLWALLYAWSLFDACMNGGLW